MLLVERWILAVLRHREFFTLSELNDAIAELLPILNGRHFQGRSESRRDLFEALDRPALRPLPDTPYEFAMWKHAKVGPDYHVQFAKAFYSVPHGLYGKIVDLRVTASVVEIMHRGQRVAAHARNSAARFHTIPEHMPAAHRAHAEWTPRRFLKWGSDIGGATAQIVRYQLEDRPHPEHGYRSCLGLLTLAKRYGKERLENACRRAVRIEAMSASSVRSILTKGLDKLDEPPAEVQQELPLHENVRGPECFT